MKKIMLAVYCIGLFLILSACQHNNKLPQTKTLSEKPMKLLINDNDIPVIWENNTAVQELLADVTQQSLIVTMNMYGGFEQVGNLGKRYTQNDSNMTTQSGDIVLYNGNHIVLFYGSNSWSYTKLGKINLSNQDIT